MELILNEEDLKNLRIQVREATKAMITLRKNGMNNEQENKMKVTSIKASTIIRDNDLCINLHNDLFVMMIWVYANGAASITSDLKYNSDETECDGTLQQYNTAIDAIESLVLGHAAAGVDICELPYLVGLEAAIEAVENHTGSSKIANGK